MSGSVVQRATVAVGSDSAGRGCERRLSAEGFAGVSQDGCLRFAFDLCPVSCQMLDTSIGAGFALLA